ncbi:MAG: hypothetical protein QM762_09920 [Chryseolinea sp.]
MARMNNSGLFAGISGRVGNLVFRRTVNGIVVANRPKKSNRTTPAQDAVRYRFADAAFYARAHMLDPVTQELYASGVNKKCTSPYAVAMSDYLRRPSVERITTSEYSGEIGHSIQIIAKDDFCVVSVSVKIQDASGRIIECGEATPHQWLPDRWTYMATQSNRSFQGSAITITALDFAGNIGSKTVTL